MTNIINKRPTIRSEKIEIVKILSNFHNLGFILSKAKIQRTNDTEPTITHAMYGINNNDAKALYSPSGNNLKDNVKSRKTPTDINQVFLNFLPIFFQEILI